MLGLRSRGAGAACRPRRSSLSPTLGGKAAQSRRSAVILECPGTLWVPLQTSHQSADCVSPVNMEKIMDNLSEWTEQLLEAEQQIAGAYEILATLQADLKAAGRKKDTMAIGEVVERLAR